MDIWNVRHFIYNHIAQTTTPPGLDEIALALDLSLPEVKKALEELDALHALFLDPGTYQVHIANPFSGLPDTGFVVDVGGKTYWANCAWDSYGVIAALQAENGDIRAACAYDGQPLHLKVRDGQAISAGEVIHFQVPFSQWYDDMVFT